MSERETYTATRTIKAAPKVVFGLIADPRSHADLDASRTVQGTESPRITESGQVFVMRMYREDLGHYRSRNTVLEFVDGSRVTWAPELDRSFECPLVEQLAAITTGGHTYTYSLLEVPGGTEVTEIYDWSTVKDPRFAAFCPFVTQEQLDETLANLATVAEARARA